MKNHPEYKIEVHERNEMALEWKSNIEGFHDEIRKRMAAGTGKNPDTIMKVEGSIVKENDRMYIVFKEIL
jgi:hypothetical protein